MCYIRIYHGGLTASSVTLFELPFTHILIAVPHSLLDYYSLYSDSALAYPSVQAYTSITTIIHFDNDIEDINYLAPCCSQYINRIEPVTQFMCKMGDKEA